VYAQWFNFHTVGLLGKTRTNLPTGAIFGKMNIVFLAPGCKKTSFYVRSRQTENFARQKIAHTL